MTEKFDLAQRVEFIKKACQGKKVLHLGCANYPYTLEALQNKMLLHLELAAISKNLFGLDFDQRGIDILAERGVKNLFRGDLEKLEETEIGEIFDVIVAGEVIEHLSNPALFLRGVKRFMNKNSTLLLTTVNAYCGMRFFQYALRGKGGRREPVHPDHVAYYSFSTLRLLLKRENYKIERFLYYDLGLEHRPHNSWYYNFVNDLCVRWTPQLADGIIAECRLSETEENK